MKIQHVFYEGATVCFPTQTTKLDEYNRGFASVFGARATPPSPLPVSPTLTIPTQCHVSYVDNEINNIDIMDLNPRT